jgi:hypothetical protein
MDVPGSITAGRHSFRRGAAGRRWRPAVAGLTLLAAGLAAAGCTSSSSGHSGGTGSTGAGRVPG